MTKKFLGILGVGLMLMGAVAAGASILDVGILRDRETGGGTELPDAGAPLQADYTFLTVPGCAFNPQSESGPACATWGYHMKIFGTLEDDFREFFCPLMLPENAEISELAFWWKDGNAGYDGRLQLIRHNLVNGSATILASCYTTGSQFRLTMTNTFTVSNPTIDSDYTYYLRLLLYKDIEFHGTRLRYVPAEDSIENRVFDFKNSRGEED